MSRIRSLTVIWMCLFPGVLAWADESMPVATESSPPPAVEELVQQVRKSIAVITVQGRDGRRDGIGTGFVIRQDGLIATNLHVIGQARPIQVRLADGRRLPVQQVYASDQHFDLAVLRVAADDLQPLPMAASSEVTQGQAVIAMGNPMGLEHSVVTGVISGQREIDGRDYWQLAIPIEPGNSGGPVLDRQGRVLGIVTMKSAVTANLGFALHSDALLKLLETPNPIPIERWQTIGMLDDRQWKIVFGARWQQRGGRIVVSEAGEGFGGRALCLAQQKPESDPFEVGVWVKLDDESGAAGLVFHADGRDRHYGFYPSAGRLRLTRFDGPSVFTWKILRELQSDHYRPGEWNHLKIRVAADRIECFVNDQPVIDLRDQGLTSGHVGLAKFRDTSAEFRQFRIGPQLPPSQPPAALVDQLQQQIEQLIEAGETTAADIPQLAKTPEASREVIAARAHQLERQAAELRQLAEDVHTEHVCSQLQQLINQPDTVDLVRGSLLISQLDNRQLDVTAYEAELERMAQQIRQSLAEDAGEAARLQALNDYLFQQNGFHGSRVDYYHQANSYLDRVIDDREGLPITLSVLYLALGQRLDLPIEAVGLPGHFVVRYAPADNEPQWIDPFHGGKRLSQTDVEAIVQRATGRALRDEDVQTTEARQILLRMLRNLLHLARSSNDHAAMLRYLEAMVTLDPEEATHRGMRAIVRHQTGRHQGALADLDWLLNHQPADIDLDRIREMKRLLERDAR